MEERQAQRRDHSGRDEHNAQQVRGGRRRRRNRHQRPPVFNLTKNYCKVSRSLPVSVILQAELALQDSHTALAFAESISQERESEATGLIQDREAFISAAQSYYESMKRQAYVEGLIKEALQKRQQATEKVSTSRTVVDIRYRLLALAKC